MYVEEEEEGMSHAREACGEDMEIMDNEHGWIGGQLFLWIDAIGDPPQNG